jgi:WD40 repeat protein
MNEDRRQRTWAVFNELADVPPARRKAVLEAACQGDSELRAAVERLLACEAGLGADESEGSFLKSPLVRTPEPPAAGAAPPPGFPSHIGRYRILRRVGEGGMGTVYEAEQENPRRTVALKVILPGLLAPGLIKRFTREAQILGRLQHPGIAAVYEAGLAAEGQLFFAMEYVRGQRLDVHARLRSLTLPARLELLARVCDAVQHAHDRGVIHRDLKPANILVDETGQPKVLDFGVARATDADLQTTAGRTQAGQLLGTLRYMSPEQVAADPAAIDPRSDIYALGVILYELLAGRLPYPLDDLPLPEVGRVIREVEPSRLGAVAAHLRGDVETIVAKALEKDKAQRYASAAELASDIRRHLGNEPIRARPPSALYHVRKFVRRYKALVGALAGLFTALVLGMIGTLLFAVREAEQRREAVEERKAAMRQAYRAHLAAAGAALQNHDVADAAHQLDAAPEELRDWEWLHLRSRLDDRSGQIVAEPGATLFLLNLPERIQIGQFVPDRSLRLTDLGGHQARSIAFNPTAKAIGQILQSRGGLRFLEWHEEKVPSIWNETALPRLRLTFQVVCRVSPDASCLAVPLPMQQADRADLALYESASGQRTALCVAHKAQIWALAFSPDGTRVASVDDAGLVCVWNAATGTQVAACRGHTRKVLSAAFRPDGVRLVTTSADGTVRQWDPATGREIEPPYDRHSGEVLASAYSPDGEWIVSGGADRTVRVWRASGRQEVAVLHGHTGAVTEVAFTPDGRRLASVSQDRGHEWSGDNSVGIWDADFRAGLPVLRGHTSYVYPVAFSPDGRWFASGGWDGTVRLWEAATGEPCATWPDLGIVRALAFSPDGRWLVIGDEQQDRLRLWEVATARVRAEIRGLGKSARFLAVSSDGTRIAATALDLQTGYHLSVCDVSSGERLFATAGAGLAYSPDGRWLATRSAEGTTVVLRDAQTHQMAAHLSGHEALVHTAAFSSDSRRLATCSQDGTIRLWEITPLTQPSAPEGEGWVRACHVLRGHTDEVFAVAFHPGGTRLASAGRDRAVWLWDLAKGEPVVRLQGHTSYVWSLAFSPDGKTLVSGSGDSTVRLWDTAPLAVRYQARREAEALRPKAEQLVEQLFREKNDTEAVIAALRAEEALSEPLRQAALRAFVRRQAP